MVKGQSLSVLIHEADLVFSKYIRKRDANLKPPTLMKNHKLYYENEVDRSLENGITRGFLKAVAIGFLLSLAVVYAAIRLWVVFQRP